MKIIKKTNRFQLVARAVLMACSSITYVLELYRLVSISFSLHMGSCVFHDRVRAPSICTSYEVVYLVALYTNHHRGHPVGVDLAVLTHTSSYCSISISKYVFWTIFSYIFWIDKPNESTRSEDFTFPQRPCHSKEKNSVVSMVFCCIHDWPNV